MLYSTTSPGYEQIQEQVADAQAIYEAASSAVEQFERTSAERELGRQIGQKLQILLDLEAGQLAAARGQVGRLLARLNEIDQLAFSAASLRAQLGSSPGSAELSAGEQFALFSLEASAFAPSTPFSVTLDFGEGWMEDAAISAGQAVDRLDSLQVTLEMAKERLQADVAELSLALLEGSELLTYGPDGEGAPNIARLQEEINSLRAELQAEQQARQDLLDEQQLARENYLTLSRKAAEVQILSELTSVEVQIAAAAREPEKPAFPSPLFTTALAMAAGALAGTALAFFLETQPAQED
jgi:chromosome segregation ATPase